MTNLALTGILETKRSTHAFHSATPWMAIVFG
jgi:hypothetical protein